MFRVRLLRTYPSIDSTIFRWTEIDTPKQGFFTWVTGSQSAGETQRLRGLKSHYGVYYTPPDVDRHRDKQKIRQETKQKINSF
jgi:hypothetical protein